MIINNIKSIARARHTQIIALLVVVVVIGVSASASLGSHAATTSGTLTMSPASGTYTVGNIVTISVAENSGSTAVNGVEADISYPASDLQYESYSVANSGFNYPGPAPTITNGSFKYAILSETSLTGSQSVLTISFMVLAPGTANVSFMSSAAVATTAGANEGAATSGSTLTLQAVPVVTPPVTTPTPPTTPVVPPTITTPTKSQTPTPASTASSSAASSAEQSTSITPTGSSTSVPVSSGSSVKVTAPATMQPTVTTIAPSESNPVVKVEYYLNKKLLAVQTTAPFSYKLNTRNILNGEYTFTTKTYYASGKMTSSSQDMFIDNPESLTQVKLAARQYAGDGGLVLLLLVIVFLVLFSRNRISHYLRNRMMLATTPPQVMDTIVVQGHNPTVKNQAVQPPNTVIPPEGNGKPEIDLSSIRTPVQPPGTVYRPVPKDDDKS
jgi:hypothetical protein